MEISKTSRGFDLIKFEDENGIKCSLQKSSSMNEDLIWLGCSADGIKTFKGNGTGWQTISFDEIAKKLDMEHVIADDRMHLSREQVKQLLPYLKKFVKTGEII